MRSFFLFLILTAFSSTAFAQDEQFEVEILQRAVRERVTAAKTVAEDQLSHLQTQRSGLILRCVSARAQYKQAFLLMHSLESDSAITWLESAREYAQVELEAIEMQKQKAVSLQEKSTSQAIATGAELTELDVQISALEGEISVLKGLLVEKPIPGSPRSLPSSSRMFPGSDRPLNGISDHFDLTRSSSQIAVVFPLEFDSCPVE